MLPVAVGPVKTESLVPLKGASDSSCVEMPMIPITPESISDGIHMRSAVSSSAAESIVDTRISDRSVNWDFYDERMKNLRRLLQLTFLVDMLTYSQAALNKRLGLARYCYLFSYDPRTSVGYGTLLRCSLYLVFICTYLAMSSKVLFILPKSVSGADDYTQLPVKVSFLLFGIEVIITMISFSRAAISFSSRHISRKTVRKMSTGILIFSSSLFWLSYSVIFLTFIFYKKGELVSVSNTSKSTQFAFDMYRMHKIWTDEWIDQPAFLLFYSSAMFVAFSIYIVSNTVFSFFVWCIWMQVRKLLARIRNDTSQFKQMLLHEVPLLINELETLKQQWRLQIIVYISLDVLVLLAFSLELQFILFNRQQCFVPIVPLLLFMFNVSAHLFSFLFGIAILNDSFSKIESAAWKNTGFKIPPLLRTPEQISALKDPELGILLLGFSTNKLRFKIGSVTIDWAFIWTMSGLAGTLYGLAIPTLGSLGKDRVC